MKTPKLVDVDILDIAVLLWHVFRAAQTEEIGYNDVEMSLARLKKETNVTKRLSVSILEKLLYGANMMNEQGQFWHYDGIDFDTFLKRFELKYDQEYGWVK